MKFSLVNPWSVILVSSISLVILAVFSVGYLHPDEHFQILEFAALKLKLTVPENLPWEYHTCMRPAIQPAIVVFLHRILGVFGYANPFGIAMLLRFLTGVLSLLSMWMIYRSYSEKVSGDTLRKWFLMLSFLLWFALYNNVRFCSETWSGALFIIAFSYLNCIKRKALKVDFFLTGLFLGLSFIFRYQAGFLVAGFLAWFIVVRKERWLNIMLMISGICLVFLAGIVTDNWFYGKWTLTAWNYFQQNILQDKVSGFGTNPWYFYFWDIFVRAVPPFSLLMILSFILLFIFRPRDILTWTLVPFMLIHFMIGHKEARFFYPLIGFVPVVMISAAEIMVEKWGFDLIANKYFRLLARFTWIVNLGLILLVFNNPADSLVSIYKDIYNHYNYPVTLYYLNENPYQRALEIHYYKRNDLVIRKASGTAQLNADYGPRFLVAAKSHDNGVEQIIHKRLVWSSYPEWIKMFNFNHWVERTDFWEVYEVDNRKGF